MSAPRLFAALNAGGLLLPDAGRIAVLSPSAEFDLSALPKERVHVVQGFFPDHQVFQSAGYDCATQPDGPYAMTIVCLPRAKAEARAMIAQAVACTPEGLIVIDGQKTDGVESVLKDLRKRVTLLGVESKAHGKIGWFASVDGFSDWASPTEPQKTTSGFVTAPGVFSADGPDPASEMLITCLPPKLGKTVVDLGAGWGFLSARLSEVPSLEILYLVEAEADALVCARINVADGRARFHWADATEWGAQRSVDTVVMNPPFHTHRTPDAALGRAFIINAARLLKPNGHLWMVANRHLPYELALSDHFGMVTEVTGDARFKVFHATKPRKAGRV